MFKLLKNCVRIDRLSPFYELKIVGQRQFTSKAVDNNVNRTISNQASANYCFNLVK